MNNKFQKLWYKICEQDLSKEETAREGWNAALNSVLAIYKYRNKQFENMWQHEDLDYLIEDIRKMRVKD